MQANRAKRRMNQVLAVLLTGLLLSSASARAVEKDSGFRQVTEPCGLTFPSDHGAHAGFRTEWWYFTGNLAGATGRRLAFQLTFFRHQLAPGKSAADGPEPRSAWRTHQLYLAHAAVSDIQGERHLQAEKASREALGMAGWAREGERTTVFVDDWQAVMAPGGVRLAAAAAEFSFDLELTPRKAPVLHGDQGYSRKGSTPERASCYYSMTRLETIGSLTLTGERPMAVTGLSWMDHEFSTAPLEPGTVGWDWFSLQLDDRSEFMIFLLRQADGGIQPVSSGTYVDAEGNARHLERDAFDIDVLDTWKSDRSGAVYPAGWRIRIRPEGIDLIVTPNLPDQEMGPGELTGITYWEGSVAARGVKQGEAIAGMGYIELTGYAGPFEALK